MQHLDLLDIFCWVVHNRRYGVQRCTKEADTESERKRAGNNSANGGETIKGHAKMRGQKFLVLCRNMEQTEEKVHRGRLLV